MDFSAAERARRIRLILFDVDGVLTDGKIWTLPAGAEQTFEAKDFTLTTAWVFRSPVWAASIAA